MNRELLSKSVNREKMFVIMGKFNCGLSKFVVI